MFSTCTTLFTLFNTVTSTLFTTLTSTLFTTLGCLIHLRIVINLHKQNHQTTTLTRISDIIPPISSAFKWHELPKYWMTSIE
jgi:hypothetical protein